jgi:hypothetical protein
MRPLIDFLFPRRIGRLGYFWRILATNLAIALIIATSPTDQLFPIVGIGTIGVYQFVFILLPRVRDTGMSGWLVLLSLVPIVYLLLTIILLFRPSQYHFEADGKKLAPGDRVRISKDYHWAQGSRGTISHHFYTVAKDLMPRDQCFRKVKSLQGMLTFYWVKFDEPQRDAEGDLYSGGEIDDRYLIRDKGS